MKLSTRVRYGIRAMIELAKAENGAAVPLRQLARNQGVSSKYLEQMASSLKIAGLIESVRGAEGGYRLGRPAKDITAWDIYCVLDIATEPVDCIAGHCDRVEKCSAGELWREMTEAIETVLKSRTLRDLADREKTMSRRRK